MRQISMAAGTLPEFDPVTVVESAARGGFTGCGVWFDKEAWRAETPRAVAAAFTRMGTVPLEIEVLVVGDPTREPHHAALLDAGAEIGCTEAIVVSREADVGRNIERIGALNGLALERGIRLCLEFLPIFAVRDLETALAIRAGVGDNLKLLVDTLHVPRTGTRIDALAELPEACFSFIQFCDAPLAAPGDDFEALYDEALNGRLLPGEGELPLESILAALPAGLPLSLELRARWLRERYPDPAARAAAVFEATRSWLAGHGLE